MAEGLARYACDTCRSRKVACSREPSACARCREENITCYYSRSGVIRRQRRKHAVDSLERPHGDPLRSSTQPSSSRQPLVHPVPVEGTTHDRLRQLRGGDHESLREVAALLEEFAAVWQDSSAFASLAQGAAPNYYLFGQDQMQVWIDLLARTLRKEALFFSSAPAGVPELLMSSLPNSSLDRAWLVMFYSIALSNGSTFSSDESIKLNLRSNLWLSFNDARLLLEPNTLSIQALVIMAQYLEEHITPSTYWVLMNKACVMLQALGSTSWRHDRSVQDQRAAVFWRLNFVDKAMALVLSRQPAIHREVAIQTPPPTVSQLLDTQPHRLSGRSSLFYAHYAHQMHLLSHGMAEVWHCVYAPNLDQASTTKEDLESWYTQATDILKAAALTEQPLLAPADAATVDLSLQILDFQYYALLVRLALSSRETMGTQAVSASVKLLRLLPSIHGVAVTGQEIFPFPVWQWLHCPLSAFGLCWGQIVTGMHPQYEENKQLLETIELLPPFFGSLIARNPIAEKLENITKRMIQHASSITQSSNSTSPANAGPYQSSVVMSPTSAGTPLDDFLAPSAEFSLDEMFSMGNDALLNNPFDWFGWDMSGPAAQSH